MIEEFSFGNFWSFKDIQTLNITAAKIKSKNVELDATNVFSINSDISLLKTKAIYGANASGKSNVIKALSSFIRIIYYSVERETILEIIDAFQLNSKSIVEPTFFQMIFRIGKIRFRYGFECDKNSIKSEWLFSTPKKREQVLFIRENNKVDTINQTHFEEGTLYQKLFENSNDPIFTPTSLFLSHLSKTGFGKLSKQIVNTIASITIIPGLGHQGMVDNAINSLNEMGQKKFILDFLQKADIGIEDLYVVEMANDQSLSELDSNEVIDAKKRKVIVSRKKQYDSQNKWIGQSRFSFQHQESEGTIKMFELSPYIYSSIKNGTPLFIDEFDARFHPLLTKKIVELYNSVGNKKSQLIFTTHDTNLLSSDLLRRDQIDFVEKDKYGASHLYTLVEIKGVRNDASFEKDYIQGKYGAIPFLGDFANLLTFE